MRKNINRPSLIILALTFFLGFPAYSQHHHDSENKNNDGFHLQPFSEALSDAELKGFNVRMIEFDLAPGQSDTVSHRHNCDVFVVVLQGTAEVRQNFGDSLHVLRTGQVFHENRNVIHSLTRNPDPKIPLKLLIVFIVKEGRDTYTRLYP